MRILKVLREEARRKERGRPAKNRQSSSSVSPNSLIRQPRIRNRRIWKIRKLKLRWKLQQVFSKALAMELSFLSNEIGRILFLLVRVHWGESVRLLQLVPGDQHSRGKHLNKMHLLTTILMLLLSYHPTKLLYLRRCAPLGLLQLLQIKDQELHKALRLPFFGQVQVSRNQQLQCLVNRLREGWRCIR